MRRSVHRQWATAFGWALLMLSGLTGYAQKEFHNWYFGQNAGISFLTNPPRPLLNGQMSTLESSSTLNDSAGNVLFYSDGINVWDRAGAIMPNGRDIGSHYSACQGAEPVRQPGAHHRYYIFTMDSYEHLLADGLRYAIVDMTRRNGRGDVVLKAPSVLPGIKMTEKLTLAAHANGRDVWVLCHQWESKRFYAFLLTANGLSTTPVISDIGSVHAGPVAPQPLGNAGGYLKIAPNGRRIASAILGMQVEIFDFDPATGRLTNPLLLPHFAYNYGVEFSADNSKVYVSTGRATQVYQFDLLAGSAAAVAASQVRVTPANISSTGILGGMQRGPDGRIYIAMETQNTNGSFEPGEYLSVIQRPNTPGVGCGFVRNGFYLGGKRSLQGMPFALASAPLTVTVPPVTVCVGQPATLTAQISQTVAANAVRWRFGDPASGARDSATGLTVTHLYPRAGTYSVRVQVQAADIYSFVTTVRVIAKPEVELGPDRDVCLTQPLRISAGAQPPGATYRWQDGSTDSVFTVRAAGMYTVQVAVGTCTASDTLVVSGLAGSIEVPNVITPNDDKLNDALVVDTGCSGEAGEIAIFNRWGRQVYHSSRYANDWQAPGLSSGMYYYLVKLADGTQVKGWVEVVR